MNIYAQGPAKFTLSFLWTVGPFKVRGRVPGDALNPPRAGPDYHLYTLLHNYLVNEKLQNEDDQIFVTHVPVILSYDNRTPVATLLIQIVDCKLRMKFWRRNTFLLKAEATKHGRYCSYKCIAYSLYIQQRTYVSVCWMFNTNVHNVASTGCALTARYILGYTYSTMINDLC